MELWTIWYWCVTHLRPAFSHKRTFLWALLTLAGISIRYDRSGVTSLVRALGLTGHAYRSLLHFFHSNAVNVAMLVDCWIRLVLQLFQAFTLDGYIFFILDGLKVAKEGKKMPAVKSLHQESSNNSKAEYIMGHSLQCLALLVVGVAGCMAAVPLIAQIHEGLIWSNRDQRTLNNKAAAMIEQVKSVTHKTMMVLADAYYCNEVFIQEVLAAGAQVISRVRNNAVAYFPAIPPTERRRGRPPKYGEKVRLLSLFDQPDLFTTITSKLYGESVEVKYYTINLLWRPLKRLLKFVLVNHPTRGKAIFATTDLLFDPIKVLELYSYRYKIELSFKHALHVIGTYSYHFWMKGMEPIKRCTGDQYMHRKSVEYRDAIKQKMKAYSIHITMGCIAQGLLLHLCLNQAALVWKKFGSWLRTMKVDSAPSELVAANALRATLPDFLTGSRDTHTFKKFLLENMDTEMGRVLSLSG